MPELVAHASATSFGIRDSRPANGAPDAASAPGRDPQPVAARTVSVLVDPLLLLVLALVAVIAAAVHSALGFGSGPLLVPVLLVVFEPPVAVLAAVLVGMVVNVLQLATEGRRPHVPVRRLLPLWLGAPPGCVAGALLANRLSATVLAAAIAFALVASAVTLLFSPSAGFRLSRARMTAAGALTGASAALTGIFGPLLGVILVAAGMTGKPLRDGLGASFLVIGAMTAAASLSVSAQWSALAVAGTLTAPAACGYLLGRRGARWLDPVTQRRAVLLAVLAGAALALLSAAG